MADALSLALFVIFVGAAVWSFRRIEHTRGDVHMALDQMTVQYYQNFGFFSGRDPDKVAAEIAVASERVITARAPERDAIILSHDPTRVWPSGLAAANPISYRRLLASWSMITGKQHDFTVADEQEKDDTIELRFCVDEDQYEVTIERQGTTPLDLLSRINQLLPQIGGHFYAHHQSDGQSLIVFLTDGEAQRVWNERQFTLAGL